MERQPGTTFRGKSLEVNKTRRSPAKPNITNSLEDFGSSFPRQYPRAGTRRPNAGPSKSSFNDRERAKSTSGYLSESEDELLLSSQPSQVADDEDDSRRMSSQAKNLKRQDLGDDWEASHNPQSGRPPKSYLHTSAIVKTLSFKKNKTNGVAGPSSQTTLPVAKSLKALPSNKLPEKPRYDVRSVLPSNANPIDSGEDAVSSDCSQSKPVLPPGASSRPKPRRVTRKTVRQELALEEIPVNSQATPLSRISGRAKPAKPSGQAVACIKKPIIDMNHTRRSTLTRVHPIVGEEPSTPDSSTARVRAKLNPTKPTIQKPKYRKMTTQMSDTGSSSESSWPPVKKPRDFPMPSPQKGDLASNSSSTPDFGSKRVRKRSGKLPTLQPFPMSLSAEGKEEASPRDKLDDGNPSTGKPKPRPKKTQLKEVQSTDRLTDDRRRALNKKKHSSQPTPQPFPMSTQMLDSIGPDDSTSVPQELASHDACPKPRKKKRKSDPMAGSSSDEAIHGGYEWEEDFSVTLTVDPKLLCPFCDALLPTPITALLRKLIDNALRRSRHDPRPGNPLGRTAPSAVFITVCQRHRFESEELPKAEANRWPKEIDWKMLGNRTRNMQDDLQKLLRDLRAGAGASLIWKDVKLELQTKGSRAITSVREQFANFEKVQVGYYGELGYAIIHQTLLDIFPPTSCDLDFIDPLTPEQFIQCVLVPEVAMRLIQGDMGLDGASAQLRALQVLRDSSKYGVAMFPDESTENPRSFAEPDQLGVADLIVMERARKRRKEIEEEYQREQEEESRCAEERRRQKERKRRCKDRKSDKEKSTRREEKLSSDERDHDTEEAEIPRPKPRPIRKNRSTSQPSPLPQESATDYSCHEGSAEERASFPWTSQGSTTPYGSLEAPLGYNLPVGWEDDILVPNSDEGGENKIPSLAARRGPSQTTTHRMSDPAAQPSSEEKADVRTPARRRRKNRHDSHDSEDWENTPKPSKFRRTGLLGHSQKNSQPLLLARRRNQQQTGNESTSATTIAGSSSLDSADKGLWLKSMVDPIPERADFSWLLSDSSQE